MNQESTSVNYSLALRSFSQNSRGRSMCKICVDYWRRNDEIGDAIRIGRVAGDETGFGKW